MGLLSKVLLLPITGPIDGLVWIGETLKDQAEREVYDEDAIYQALMELELRLELGEISEEEHAVAEEQLLALLQEARRRRAGESG